MNEHHLIIMKTFVVAVDCGTTAIKAAVFDLSGTTRGIASGICPQIRHSNGHIETSVRTLTNTAFTSIRQAVRRSRINPKNISAISVTNQRATIICTDKNGKSLGNAVSWQDMRGVSEINSLKERIPDKRYYDITGLPNNPVFSLGKILWIRKNNPRLYEQTKRFVLVHDYFVRLLGCDDFFCDHSNASLTGLFDIAGLDWSAELLSLTGINRRQLPSLVEPGTVIGHVSEKSAAETGLRKGTTIVAGAGDQQCAGIGAGAVKPGVVEITLGTAAVPLCCSDKVMKDPKMRVTCCAHGIPGKWEVEGLQNCAGAGVKWAWHILFGNKQFDMNTLKLAEHAEPGSQGLIFLPYLDGASAPHWDPNASALFHGLKFSHGRAHLLRAVMEGVTMETRQIIDVFSSLGMKMQEVRLSGGYTGIKTWNQIHADILGMPVSVMENCQSSLVGAAILAAFGLGAFSSIETGSRKMSRIRRTFFPSPGIKSAYETVYKKYCKLSENII